MLKINNLFSICLKILLILIFLNSCSKSQIEDKDWIHTKDGQYKLWGTVNEYKYIWEGNDFDGYIHGTGKLSIYKNDTIIQVISYDKDNEAYFGTTTYKDVKKAEQDIYIGNIKDKTLSGIGILIKKNGDIYSGNFLNGKPNGKLNFYKNKKLAYSGEWKDGTYNGIGTLYKEDGSVKKGLWKNGALIQTDETVKTSEGIYSGGILNNLSDGYGTMEYNTGSIYKGTWTEGKWNGEGFFISNKKDSIAGNWYEGKLEGYGIFKSPSFLYEGDWSNNKPNGIGRIIYPDSTFYTGNWDNGKKNGYGDIIYSNNDSYFGEWVNDEPQGLGRYYFSNGDIYNGEWENGFQQGVGIFNSKDFIYQGDWQQGWIHGKGKITYPNDDDYEGDFVENKKSGIGYYHFKNGNFYEGEFIEDKFNGLGIFQFADGNRYEGTFYNGKINGDGTLYFQDGKETIAITAFWDGSNKFPNKASVLFSNGDLYEGELLNGFPTTNGTWTTENERNKGIKGIDIPDGVLRANEFYKKHKDTWDKALIITSLALTTLEVATVATGVGAPIAGAIHVVNVALNVVDASLSIASAAIDINTGLQNGEDQTEAYKNLAADVSINAALILAPKALQKLPIKNIKYASKNVIKQSIVTFSKNKTFAKFFTITKDSNNKVIKKLNNSTNKLNNNKIHKRFTKNPIENNTKLKENSKFKTGEFGYQAESDAVGRLSKVKGNLKLTKREGRLDHEFNTPGKRPNDHAGHIIGDRFGGSPELDNLVSQSKNVNLSEFKKIENIWHKALKDGKEVKVEINIKYNGRELRPDAFEINYIIDKKKNTKTILNK